MRRMPTSLTCLEVELINTDLMFSSRSVEWETPPEIFRKLNEEFHFTTDVCAKPENAKCAHYFSPDQDGLSQQWTGVCWCNPPYGRNVTGRWVEKAAQSCATTVMLLPARTDTKWFHDHIYGKAEVRFIRGRLKFGGCKDSAPFPSMVVIFRNDT